jgi:hypothetical protein
VGQKSLQLAKDKNESLCLSNGPLQQHLSKPKMKRNVRLKMLNHLKDKILEIEIGFV